MARERDRCLCVGVPRNHRFRQAFAASGGRFGIGCLHADPSGNVTAKLFTTRVVTVEDTP
jgi:hypothetical protein